MTKGLNEYATIFILPKSDYCFALTLSQSYVEFCSCETFIDIYKDDWKIEEIQNNLHKLGSLIRKENFIKIGCLEEPKPTYPSSL